MHFCLQRVRCTLNNLQNISTQPPATGRNRKCSPAIPLTRRQSTVLLLLLQSDVGLQRWCSAASNDYGPPYLKSILLLYALCYFFDLDSLLDCINSRAWCSALVCRLGLLADTLLRYLKKFSMSVVGAGLFSFFFVTLRFFRSTSCFTIILVLNGKHLVLNWVGDANYDET